MESESMAFQYPVEETNKMQELYERCRMVFSGYESQTPALDEVRWLQEFLETIEAVDVGIDGEGVLEEEGERRLFPGRKVEEITYIHIHDCGDFSMGVFCFPAGATLPLHDHPEMVVLSRVLYGSVVQRAYDWVQPPDCFNNAKLGLGRLVVHDQVLQNNSPVSVLFPTSGGNIHSFTALTPCAFLDVLAPPYSEVQGRPSTYYSEIAIANLSDFVILKEMDVPEDLTVRGAPYLGSEIVLDDSEYDNDDDDDDDIDDDS